MKRAAIPITFAMLSVIGCAAAPTTVPLPQPTQQTREVVRQALMGSTGDLSPKQLQDLLEPIITTPGQPRQRFARDARLAMAWLHEQMERFDEAREIYLVVIEEHRRIGSAMSLPLADALYRYAQMEANADQLEKAITLLDESVEIHQRRDRFGYPQKLGTMIWSALLRTYLGRDQEAMTINDMAIKLHPSLSWSYAARATNLMLTEQYQPALNDIVSAYKFKSTAMNDLANIAWYCRLQTGDSDKAHATLVEITSQLNKTERHGFDAQITNYLLGDLPQAKLLAAANSPYTLRHRHMLGAALFFIAAKLESENKIDAANQFYDQCMANKTVASVYYHLAKIASKQLKTSP